MDRLNKMLRQVKPVGEIYRKQAQQQWNSLAKPLGSLGVLEEAVTKIQSIGKRRPNPLHNRLLLVLCADNGVIAQGVTQTDETVTASVATALAKGESTVCHMAKVANCKVLPVDVGIKDYQGNTGVLNRRVRNGTEDMTTRPAMTIEECVQAIHHGMDLVKRCKESGVDIIATGEMGIGNTTTTSAVTAVLLQQSAETVAGRGAGLSDAGLDRKINAIKTAIALHKPNPKDAIEVLSELGGLDLAALCGVCLGGAYYQVPIILDGVITTAAALCAKRLCDPVTDYLIASHVSAEPTGKLLLDALALTPMIQANLRLGEGSGAVAALPLLDMAMAVFESGQTFTHLGITPYVKQS